MPTAPTPDRASQAAIITSLISTDPEMQQLARQYVLMGRREMLNQLQRGDAQTRAAIAKSMSGAVTNLFTQNAGDDGLEELRMEMHQMMGEVRGEMGAHEGREDADEEMAAQHEARPARVMVPKS